MAERRLADRRTRGSPRLLHGFTASRLEERLADKARVVGARMIAIDRHGKDCRILRAVAS